MSHAGHKTSSWVCYFRFLIALWRLLIDFHKAFMYFRCVHQQSDHAGNFSARLESEELVIQRERQLNNWEEQRSLVTLFEKVFLCFQCFLPPASHSDLGISLPAGRGIASELHC